MAYMTLKEAQKIAFEISDELERQLEEDRKRDYEELFGQLAE